MVTIAASRAWAVSMLRWRSWMRHLLMVGRWSPWSCGQAPLPRQRGGALLPLPRSGSRSGCRQTRTTSGGGTGGLRITVVANPPGNQPSRDHHSSCTPKPVELPVERAGPSTRGVPAVSLVLLPMTGCRSLHRRVSWSFLGKTIRLRCCYGSSNAWVGSRITAMLSWAAERVGLEWRLPPCPEPSRLDDWFLGVVCAGSQHPALVPLFPEVHGELTRLWMAHFTARNWPASSSSLTTLGGGAARGYTGPPRWSGRLRCRCVLIPPPPGRVNRASSSGPVGTRLVCPAMLMWPVEKLPTACATALLQVLQAKSTGGHARGWSRSRSSERALYHFWPRATSDEGHCVVFGSCDVHTCGPGASPGCVWSTWGCRQSSVPQGPCVPDWPLRRRSREHGPAVLGCLGADWGDPTRPAQWAAAASTRPLAAAPQPARRRGRPLRPSLLPHRIRSSLQKPCRWAGRRQAAPPVLAPIKPGGERKSKRPQDGWPRGKEDCFRRWWMHLSLPRRRAGRRIFGLKKKKKKSRQEAVLSASGSQEGMERHGRTNTGPHSSPSLASRQQWAVRERHQRPYSRTLCQTVEPGKCCTAHSDPSLVRPGPGPCVSPRCPTAGTSVVPQVPLV